MNSIVASRGPFGEGSGLRIGALPLVGKDTIALSVCLSRGFVHHYQKQRGSAYQKQWDTCVRSVDDLSRALWTSQARAEGLVKTGNFISEVMRLVDQRKPVVVVLSQEQGPTTSLDHLVRDGICLLHRCRIPVVLLPTAYDPPKTGRVVIGAVVLEGLGVIDGSALQDALNLAGREVVVAAIARPFYPPFSRLAPGMGGTQSRALREVWESQASSATAQAGMIANQLADSGCKPLYVGRTGHIAGELQQIAESDSSALICILVDHTARKWLSRSLLVDLLRTTNTPVMLLPTQNKRIS